MPRLKTIRRFDEWKGVEANVDAFFRELEGTETVAGKRFRDACVAMKVPYTLMFAFVHGSDQLKARYESVLAAKADDLVHQALDDAEEAIDRDSAAGARVKADTKLRVASKWDRDRYGERLSVEKTISLTDDAGLIGTARDLLALARTGRLPAPEKVIEAELVELDEDKS